MSISSRIQHSRLTLDRISDNFSLGHALVEADRAIGHLLPDRDLLDESLMGLWFGVQVTPNGAVGLKIYVNERVGDWASRYYRFTNCLAAFGRLAALQHLADLVKVIGTRAIPVSGAFDLGTSGIGRLKLYFRALDGTPAFLAAAAEALGCVDATRRLARLHKVLLQGPSYPAHAVIFSAEFPATGDDVGFKLDVNTGMVLSSDLAVDYRVEELIGLMGLDDAEYRLMRDVVVGRPSSTMVAQILFVGLALRALEQRLNVYFHPAPCAG